MQANNFKELMNKIGISVSEMANSLGMSEAYVYKIRNGEREMSKNMADKLYNLYKVNPDYLLYGLGEMFKQAEKSGSTTTATAQSGFYYEGERVGIVHKPIPYYDIEVSAGDVNFYQDFQGSPSFMLDIPIFNDCELALTVYGDSMYPKIKNGDIILLKKLNDKSIIAFGEIHLVITMEQRLLKYVRKHSEKIKLRLVSENPEYDDIEIESDKVLHLFLYKGKIEKSQI